MHQIEFELQMSATSENNSEVSSDSTDQNSADLAIEFSAKLVEALKAKVKDHNSNCDKKVNLEQLKTIYRRAAGNTFEPIPELCERKGQWAMARVNFYLKFLKDVKLANIKSYNLTCASNLIDELDFTVAWVPNLEDFIDANEDIKKYNLDYDFSNIDELYLEQYNPVGYVIED